MTAARFAPAVLTLALLASVPPTTRPADATVVGAASSLRDVVRDAVAALGPADYAIHTAGSAVLARQIERGAPIAVFLSSSAEEVDRLVSGGSLDGSSRAVLAGNDLVAVAPAGARPPDPFEEIASPDRRRIAIANPRTAPAGRYAVEALTSLGIFESVEPRAVYAENVRQALEYVARGDADAGIVYASDVAAFPDRVAAGAVAPAGSHGPVVYVGALSTAAEGRDPRAAALLDWLCSPAGRAAFARHGFRPARERGAR